jgi:mRNA interferase RelE/StbE
MASYSLFVKRSAEKELRKIPSKDLSKIIQKIKSLSEHPRPVGCEILAGDDVLYRIRQGDYRIIYEIDDALRQIAVLKIGHRREVYR